MINGLMANALYTIHQGKSGGRGLSPRLWSRVAGQALSPEGFSNAFFASDDFSNFSGFSPAIAGTTALPSATVPAPGGYGMYLDTGTAACSIANLATEDYGVARLATPAQDNHEVWASAQGNSGVFGALRSTAPRMTLFESRFRVGSVADDVNSIFLGLHTVGGAAADRKVDNTGAMADAGFIGVQTLHTNGGTTGTNAVARIVYRKQGSAIQTVGTFTIAANTWYKFGVLYDPNSVSERLSFFIDNVRFGTVLSAADCAAAVFPDAVRMSFLAGTKNGTTTAATLDLDWWAYYQQVS